jgi:hypothetical protein
MDSTEHTPTITFDDLPEQLKVAEFMQLYRLSRSAAYDAIKRGDVASVRIGRSIRIPASALKG